jgi:hypothetical protein
MSSPDLLARASDCCERIEAFHVDFQAVLFEHEYVYSQARRIAARTTPSDSEEIDPTSVVSKAQRAILRAQSITALLPRIRLAVAVLRGRSAVRKCPLVSDDPAVPRLDGILSYLADREGGCSPGSGALEVTASTKRLGRPWAVAEVRTESTFASEDSADQWIQYRFLSARVSVSAYSLARGDASVMPRSWRIEASARGDGWVEIDARNDVEWADDVITIECVGDSNRCFQMVRFVQTGKSSNGDHQLVLRAFELFGEIQNDE